MSLMIFRSWKMFSKSLEQAYFEFFKFWQLDVKLDVKKRQQFLISVVAECLQRFVVLKSWRTGLQLNEALDEDFLGNPLEAMRMIVGHLEAHVKFLPENDLKIPNMCLNNRHLARCKLSKSSKLLKRLALSRTAMRPFVYQTVDESLIQRITDWLEKWCKKSDVIPRNVSDLSFWAAQQIPTSEELKLQILAENCPQARLRVSCFQSVQLLRRRDLKL